MNELDDGPKQSCENCEETWGLWSYREKVQLEEISVLLNIGALQLTNNEVMNYFFIWILFEVTKRNWIELFKMCAPSGDITKILSYQREYQQQKKVWELNFLVFYNFMILLVQCEAIEWSRYSFSWWCTVNNN